jgi:MraZ protein
MLLGNYLAKLDLQKGRTSLPSKFRKLLGKKVIITNGYDRTLMIIGLGEWEKVVGGIINQPFIKGPARETDRFILGSAFEADLDPQGRFIIPQTLRQRAELTEKIVFVGVGNRIEIWNQDNWEKHQIYLDKNIEAITNKLDVSDKQ